LITLRRFPFVWGAGTVTAPAPAAAAATFWTKQTLGAMTWSVQDAGVLPRFQRLYPQEADATFTWVRTEAP